MMIWYVCSPCSDVSSVLTVWYNDWNETGIQLMIILKIIEMKQWNWASVFIAYKVFWYDFFFQLNWMKSNVKHEKTLAYMLG